MGQGYALLWSTRDDSLLADATGKKIAALYDALERAIVCDLIAVSWRTRWVVDLYNL